MPDIPKCHYHLKGYNTDLRLYRQIPRTGRQVMCALSCPTSTWRPCCWWLSSLPVANPHTRHTHVQRPTCPSWATSPLVTSAASEWRPRQQLENLQVIRISMMYIYTDMSGVVNMAASDVCSVRMEVETTARGPESYKTECVHDVKIHGYINMAASDVCSVGMEVETTARGPESIKNEHDVYIHSQSGVVNQRSWELSVRMSRLRSMAWYNV